MAPPWVLLQRKVRFVHGERAPARSTRRTADLRRKMSFEDDVAAMAANLEAMKPDQQLFDDPPAVNRLSMVRPVDARMQVQQMDGVHGGSISSTDKALVLLYAGGYQPGFTNNLLSGCYLVYDASDNSVSAIPQLPDSHSFLGLGRGAAILSTENGDYLLAELVAARSGFPKAVLFRWWSCRRNQVGQWIRREVCLPQVFSSPDYFFRIDMAFTHAGSQICWVDLLKGVLVCDDIQAAEPKFTFVPLPTGCDIDIPHRRRPHAQEFRTMGSVGGAIRFATLHGYYEGLSSEEVTLETWILSQDLKCWVPGRRLCVGDLFNCFVERKLPKVTPSFPVLSMKEPDVVYAVLNEIDWVDVVDIMGDVCGVNNRCKAQYVIGLDTVKKEVLRDTTKFIPDKLVPRFSNVIASEFTAHLQRSMEGGLEASEAGGSLQPMKHPREPRRSKKRVMH